MGLAMDTILVTALNPSTGPTAGNVANSGDPLSIRNFNPPDQAFLENIIRMGTTAGFAQVRSPLLHDNVQGIRITPAESPSVFSLPGVLNQQVQPQDTLIVEMSGGAAESDIVLVQNYYTNLPGAAARLHAWSDIQGLVANVKPIRCAVTSSATVGAWQDTVITTSENLLKANTDYAVLGYMANSAFGFIGLKGPDTGNLRAGGPGSTQEFPTTQFFVRMSQDTGRPHIPVFNAANANATFISVCAATASVAGVVELVCAQLSQNLSN